MSTIAMKLKTVGYHTVMAGKWDAGIATPTHTPHGRGYDSALTYFGHDNSYWTDQTQNDSGCGDYGGGYGPVDLYDTTAPAWGLNGTNLDTRNLSAYEETVFMDRLRKELTDHDPSQPLFLFYAAHLVHDPYEVPQQYLDKMSIDGGGHFDNSSGLSQDTMRMTYAAMVNFLDDQVETLVSLFKAKQMWNNTIMLFISDNGGPNYAGGNNFPLRGGKYSEFEGGVRVNAFASGGLISPVVRGTRSDSVIAFADVYATLCALAGADASDPWAAAAGLPPPDGLDVSQALLGLGSSPRTDVPLTPMNSIDIKAALTPVSAKGACYTMSRCNSTAKPFKIVKGKAHDCCDVCTKHYNPGGGKVCRFTMWDPDMGECHLYSSDKSWINGKGTCTWQAALNPAPTPVMQKSAGYIEGDLKLIIGVNVRFTIRMGPAYPNASTPYTPGRYGVQVPGFACSAPRKLGCLFNVSADPNEYDDLIFTQPEDAAHIFDKLLNASINQFDPLRGDADPKACTRVNGPNQGFYGPWLELDEATS